MANWRLERLRPELACDVRDHRKAKRESLHLTAQCQCAKTPPASNRFPGGTRPRQTGLRTGEHFQALRCRSELTCSSESNVPKSVQPEGIPPGRRVQLQPYTIPRKSLICSVCCTVSTRILRKACHTRRMYPGKYFTGASVTLVSKAVNFRCLDARFSAMLCSRCKGIFSSL